MNYPKYKYGGLKGGPNDDYNDYRSKNGYNWDSEFIYEPQNFIYSPNKTIDTDGLAFDIIANGRHLPKQTGVYKFDTEHILEPAFKGWGKFNSERSNINLMGGFNSPHLSGFAMAHTPASAESRKHFPGFVSGNIQGNFPLSENLTFSGGPSGTFMPGKRPQWGIKGKLNYRFQGGGENVSSMWQRVTGSPWSDARKRGLTTGSYDDNIALLQRLRAGDFSSAPAAPVQKPAPVINQSVIQSAPVENNVINQKPKSGNNNDLGNLDSLPTFADAFRQARETLGPNRIFEYKGRSFGTNKKGEDFKPSKEELKKFNLDSKKTKERLKEQNATVISPYTSDNTVKLEPDKYEDWQDVKSRRDDLNKKSNAERIIEYKKNHKGDQNFVIVDKKKGLMHIYKPNGQMLGTEGFDVGTGSNEGDDQTVTKYKDLNDDGITNQSEIYRANVDWNAGNKKTGAGIYKISNIDKTGYGTQPLLNMEGVDGDVSTSFHKGRIRRDDGSRVSNGCIRCTKPGLNALSKYLKNSSEVYILPDNDENKFVIENGKLNFKGVIDDGVPMMADGINFENPKTKKKSNVPYYKDKRGDWQKGQGINRSQNNLKYIPIETSVDKESMMALANTEGGDSWSGGFNEEQYVNVVEPFAESLSANKRAIMKAAKINGDVYNEIAGITFGILGAETNYGDEHDFLSNSMRAARKAFNKKLSSPDYRAKYETFSPMKSGISKSGIFPWISSDEANQNPRKQSHGLTQFRFDDADADEREALSKVGIKGPKDLLDPEQAAIATAVVLGVRYNTQLHTEEDKNNMWETLPAKWNLGAGYSDEVKRKGSLLNLKQMTPEETKKWEAKGKPAIKNSNTERLERFKKYKEEYSAEDLAREKKTSASYSKTIKPVDSIAETTGTAGYRDSNIQNVIDKQDELPINLTKPEPIHYERIEVPEWNPYQASAESSGYNPSLVRFQSGGFTDPVNKTDSINVMNSSLEFEKAIKNLGYEQDPKQVLSNIANDTALDEYLSYEDGKIIPNFYLGRINKKETPKGYTSYHLTPNTYKMGSAQRRDGDGEIGEGYKYLEQISPTKYIASELISPDGYNTDLPTFELDSRIEPQGVRYYAEPNDKLKFPYYDPLAVTPWPDLTPEQQVERRDKYGDTGTPYDPAIPKSSASSLRRDAVRNTLTQEMKDAGFTGYSAREVLKPGSDAAKAWGAFQNKESVSDVDYKRYGKDKKPITDIPESGQIFVTSKDDPLYKEYAQRRKLYKESEKGWNLERDKWYKKDIRRWDSFIEATEGNLEMLKDSKAEWDSKEDYQNALKEHEDIVIETKRKKEESLKKIKELDYLSYMKAEDYKVDFKTQLNEFIEDKKLGRAGFEGLTDLSAGTEINEDRVDYLKDLNKSKYSPIIREVDEGGYTVGWDKPKVRVTYRDPSEFTKTQLNEFIKSDDKQDWGKVKNLLNIPENDVSDNYNPKIDGPFPSRTKKEPTYPKSAPEGYTLIKGYKAGDGKWYGNKYVNAEGDERPAGPTKEEGALKGVSGLSNFLPKALSKKQFGGSDKKIKVRTPNGIKEVEYGSPEYENYYNSGLSFYDPNTDSYVTSESNLPEVGITYTIPKPETKKGDAFSYNYWDRLTPEEKIKVQNPSKAKDKYEHRYLMEKANYAPRGEKGSWMDDGKTALEAMTLGPLHGTGQLLGVPQALATEYTAMQSGRPYDFSNALDVNPFDNTIEQGLGYTKQRTPSTLLPENTPAWLKVATDIVADPLNAIPGAGVAKLGRYGAKLPSTVLRNATPSITRPIGNQIRKGAGDSLSYLKKLKTEDDFSQWNNYAGSKPYTPADASDEFEYLYRLQRKGFQDMTPAEAAKANVRTYKKMVNANKLDEFRHYIPFMKPKIKGWKTLRPHLKESLKNVKEDAGFAKYHGNWWGDDPKNLLKAYLEKDAGMHRFPKGESEMLRLKVPKKELDSFRVRNRIPKDPELRILSQSWDDEYIPPSNWKRYAQVFDDPYAVLKADSKRIVKMPSEGFKYGGGFEEKELTDFEIAQLRRQGFKVEIM